MAPCIVRVVLRRAGFWGGGAVECRSRCSQMQYAAPAASTPVPALMGFTISHPQDRGVWRVLAEGGGGGARWKRCLTSVV